MTPLVSFVSLGPGDPALRTSRAEARLAAADEVVAADEAAAPERLVEMARAGKRVVRAVWGDALSSAQAVSEALAVARAGVAIEVVPGVGARAAAAAFAGALARATRVGAGEMGRALEGEPREAVVTLVADAGEPTQRVVVTTAGEAAARARDLGGGALVVSLGAPEDDLRWFERRPLFGKRVLVTRAQEQAAAAAVLLRDAGAEALVVPTIEIGPSPEPGLVAGALGALAQGAYDWAAFTSANGVERTWAAVEAAGKDARVFGRASLAAIGPATAAALTRHGLAADVVAREYTGEGLAEALLESMRARTRRETSRPRLVLLRAAKARDALPAALREAGWTVDVVAAYATRPPPPERIEGLGRELEAGRVDAVMFTSSSTVENLCERLGPRAAELLGRARMASIGPVTTRTARELGLRIDVEPRQATVPALVAALAESYGPFS